MEATVLRYLSMLRHIPRHPRRVTARELVAKLKGEGFQVTLRSVQRDLDGLSGPFALVCDERARPYGWSWNRDAHLDIPAMEPATALTFALARQFLEPLLPRSSLDRLKPHFEQATNLLAKTAGYPYAHWPEKVRSLPRGLKLQPPEVKPEVLDLVYQALLEDRRFVADYRPRGASDKTRYEVNPQGLVVRDGVLYLVCTLWEYEDLKQLVLHRMTAADLLDAPVKKAAGFDLDGYIQSGAFAGPQGEGTLRLEARFDPGCALHLREAHLSADQTLADEPDGWVRISATVPDTAELRWWLLGFGEGLEVVEPPELRAELANTARAMAEVYRD